jgi:hypothetical protein
MINTFYSTSKTWSLEPGHGPMALPIKIASSFGVLEYWSVGKNEDPNFNLNWFFHYSITPPLQQTAARRKDR